LKVVPEDLRLFPSTVVLKALFRSYNEFNGNFHTEHVVSPRA
jgi:hypothetical protein